MGSRPKSLTGRQIRMISALLAAGFEEEGVARVYRLSIAELAELRRDPVFQVLMARREAANRSSEEEREAQLVAKARALIERRLRELDLDDAPRH